MKKYQENALIKYKLIAHITIFYISQKAFLTKFLKKNRKKKRKETENLTATWRPPNLWKAGWKDPPFFLFQV